MVSCDFFIWFYFYDDYEGDFEMLNFSLVMEDFKLKIFLLLFVLNMSRRIFKFFGSFWVVFVWMKINGKM